MNLNQRLSVQRAEIKTLKETIVSKDRLIENLRKNQRREADAFATTIRILDELRKYEHKELDSYEQANVDMVMAKLDRLPQDELVLMQRYLHANGGATIAGLAKYMITGVKEQ
jgi:hypothetical protein